MEGNMSDVNQEAIHTPWWSDIVMYWLEDQIAVTFQSNISLSQGTDAVLKSLRLNDLKQFLKVRGFGLKPFDAQYAVQNSSSVSMPSKPSGYHSKTNGSADSSQDDLNTL